jgi:hypothetical protein
MKFTRALALVVEDCFEVAPLLSSGVTPALMGGECRNFVDLFIVFVFVNIALFCFLWASGKFNAIHMAAMAAGDSETAARFPYLDVYDPERMAQKATEVLAKTINYIYMNAPSVDIPAMAPIMNAASVVHTSIVGAVSTVQNVFGATTSTPTDSITTALNVYGANEALVDVFKSASGSLKFVGLGPLGTRPVFSTAKEKGIYYLNKYISILAAFVAKSWVLPGTNVTKIAPLMIAWKILLQTKDDTTSSYAAFSGLMTVACMFFPSTAVWSRITKTKPPTTYQLLTFARLERVDEPKFEPEPEPERAERAQPELTEMQEREALAVVRRKHRSGSMGRA